MLALPRSIVTQQEVEREILVDRKMTEAETVNLGIDLCVPRLASWRHPHLFCSPTFDADWASVTRTDEIREANGLATGTSLADLINGSYFSFPDVSTTDQEVPVISPFLCTLRARGHTCARR